MMAWGASDYYLVKAWRIMDHGPLGDRPSASSVDRFYYATDDEELYRDTGSEWQRVASRYGHVKQDTDGSKPAFGVPGRLFFNITTHCLELDSGFQWHTVTSRHGWVESDTQANRPPSTKEGRLFYETDTGRLVRDNGSSWEAIGGYYGHVYGDTLAARPSAGVVGRLYFATNINTLYRDDGTKWDQVAPPETHNTQHESGGSDELSVAGLSGDLADAQDAKAHASSHQPGQSDAISNLSRIATGTYTGDGSQLQSILGVGFEPKYVKITNRQTTDGNDIVTCWTTDQIIDDHADGGAIYQAAAGTTTFIANAINSFHSDGFIVDDDGSDQHPNKNGFDYNYICMG